MDASLQGRGETVGEDINIGGAGDREVVAQGLEHDREGECIVGICGAGDGERGSWQPEANYTNWERKAGAPDRGHRFGSGSLNCCSAGWLTPTPGATQSVGSGGAAVSGPIEPSGGRLKRALGNTNGRFGERAMVDGSRWIRRPRSGIAESISTDGESVGMVAVAR